MPTITGNYCDVSLSCAVRSVLEFLNSPIENLTLRFHTLAITRVQMFRQTTGLFFFVGFKELDDSTGCIHATGRVNSRANTKTEIVSRHLAIIATPCNVDQRSQTVINGARKIRQP